MNREKEIRLLIYEESQVIKQAKKNIKYLNMELAELQGQKKLVKGNKKRCNK